uniref:Fetal and adult testis expressed 1 n=1 Tax=Catagonus wagneri TaxID=51154 RepID=A0A8C3YG32_9CETA
MAGGPTNTKKIEMSLAEELVPRSQEPSREQVLIAEMLERGFRSLGASQRHQKSDPKPADSAAVWNMAANQFMRAGPQLPTREMSKEPDHEDARPQEGVFQGVGFLYERNLGADVIAEIGLEELNGLEMEIMRRQLQAIAGRLRALEDQGATWRHRETLFFTLLVSVCVANLWLWMRQ